MKSFALDAYLKTATGGNVIAEHAAVTDRWRLLCQRCQQMLTFAQYDDIAEEYTNKGVLDNRIQQFARLHLHLKPEFNANTNTVKFAATMHCGHPSTLSHILPNGQIFQKCLKCSENMDWMASYNKKKAEEAIQFLKSKLEKSQNEEEQKDIPVRKREGRRFR